MREYAKHSGRTATQVSRMVMELEKDFGVTLVHRSKKGINLEFTDQGKTLVEHIPTLLGNLDNIRSLLELDKITPSGVFNLYTTHFLIDYVLAPNLADLREKHPALTLNLYGTESPLVEESKRNSLVIAPYCDDPTGRIQTELKTFHVGLWASKTYVEQFGMPKHPHELSRHSFLCFDAEWHETLYPNVNWCFKNDIFSLDKKHMCIVRSSVGLLRAANSGMGIFSLSEESVKMFGGDFVRILPELEGPKLTMCLTYPEAWKNLPSIQVIESFLKDLFQTKVPKASLESL